MNTTTGKRTSLQTADKDEAQQIVEAKNNSVRQPVLNLQIAKAYLAGTDNGVASRTWQHPTSGKPVRFGFSTIDRARPFASNSTTP